VRAHILAIYSRVYCTPSGRNSKLYYYSFLGKLLRDFSQWLEKINNNRALFLVIFGLDVAKIQLKPRVECSDKLNNTFNWIMTLCVVYNVVIDMC
jgi:hypothetical protein